MQIAKYAGHIGEDTIPLEIEEANLFTQTMTYILDNIKVPPTKEVVYVALSKAPQEIIDYLALDKWWACCAHDPTLVPIYSTIARDILMERIILGDADEK